MQINQLSEYKDIIYNKLKSLEKKFELSSHNVKDEKRIVSLHKSITQIRKILQNLEENTLTWDQLQAIGISKASIVKLTIENSGIIKTKLEDFTLLADISIIEIFPSYNQYNADSLNILYSIIDYINTNYHTIFTQKVLLSSTKTNNIREHFYMQYQDIVHIFKSYVSFLFLKDKISTKQEHLIQKEHIILIKAIYTFLTGIQNYINIIQKDATFNDIDLQQPIISNDKTISIYGLSLNIALEECKTFVEEVLEYLFFQEKDIFDSMQLERKK